MSSINAFILFTSGSVLSYFVGHLVGYGRAMSYASRKLDSLNEARDALKSAVRNQSVAIQREDGE